MDFKKIEINDDTIIIPIPQNYKDCINLINSDYYRIKGKNASLTLIPQHYNLTLFISS